MKILIFKKHIILLKIKATKGFRHRGSELANNSKIKRLYAKNIVYIKVEKTLKKTIKTLTKLRQGSRLSPMLFNTKS